ncbi:MAG: hypothetical protein H6883_05115 [Rhodobiaceae bacterium]|nr:hypothetical protein [Rhodobiaceae bacterium]MCC0055499.1 hypothetical protein [Rhodobiaceae bacterium]
MTAGDEGKKDTGAARRRAVKPPTIDLKASTVEDAPKAAADKPAAAEAAPADAKAEKKAETVPPKQESAPASGATSAASASSVPPAGSKAAKPDPAPARRGIGSWVLGAIAGGIIGGAIVYGAYYFDLLPGRAPDMSAITVLQGRVDRLESRPATQAVDLKPLEDRLARLELAPAPSVDTSALEARVAALEERISGLSAASGGTVDLSPVEGRLSALEQKIASFGQGTGGESGADTTALRDEMGAIKQELQGALSALQQRTETLASSNNARAQGPEKSGQIQAALSLRDAVSRGTVSEADLQEGSSLGLAIAPLQEALQPGPVSLDALTGAFNDNAGAMIQAARPPASGVIGRIAEGARSLVTIRAAGPQAGDTPEAIISRIDAALQRGDSGLARAEFDKLPAESQAASGTFGELLKRRQTQLEAADVLVRQAIGG